MLNKKLKTAYYIYIYIIGILGFALCVGGRPN